MTDGLNKTLSYEFPHILFAVDYADAAVGCDDGWVRRWRNRARADENRGADEKLRGGVWSEDQPASLSLRRECAGKFRARKYSVSRRTTYVHASDRQRGRRRAGGAWRTPRHCLWHPGDSRRYLAA